MILINVSETTYATEILTLTLKLTEELRVTQKSIDTIMLEIRLSDRKKQHLDKNANKSH